MKDYSDPDYGKSEGDSRRFRDLGNNLFKVTRNGKFVSDVKMIVMLFLVLGWKRPRGHRHVQQGHHEGATERG